MGTNYYWYPQEPCPHCGRTYEPIHIGKSSCGWVFSLHVYPPDIWEEDALVINDIADWEMLWLLKPGSYIEDEYGKRVTPDEMHAVVTERDREEPCNWSQEMLDRNHAELGPNNLVRSKIDGRHCVGQGEGTWDLSVGEFS